MKRQIEWNAGKSNFKKHTLILDYHEPGKHRFITELLDVDTEKYDNINEAFADVLSVRQTKFVEVLYSGGMDSESVLNSCTFNKIPVNAITAKFIYKGTTLNTHDLYYAEKFCRERNIKQKLITLDVGKFFENGDHWEYLKPYNIWQSHIATHFWLFEQCTGFPVMGGEYPWPWIDKKVLSPPKNICMTYDLFLKDKGINGIGHMLGSSLESCIFLIEAHLKIAESNDVGKDENIHFFKKKLFSYLGLGNLELRMKNFGWEFVNRDFFDIHKITDEVIKITGWAWPEIIWNKKIGDALGSAPGTNNIW